MLLKGAGNDTNKRFSPFNLARSMSPLGRMRNITRQRDGSILIETSSQEQTQRVLNLKKIGNREVVVTEHPRLNSVKGVVKCWDFVDMDEEELLIELKDQKVTAIRQLKRKPSPIDMRMAQQRNENSPQWKDTGTYIVTFALPEVPSKMKAGYLELDVRPFVPDPIRCFRCQGYGHMRTSCREVAMCGRCAQEEHAPALCTSGIKCLNCGKAHVSWSKKCRSYIAEYEVQKIKVYEKVSFAEAKRIFINRTAMEDSFADTVRNTQMRNRMNMCENCQCHKCLNIRNGENNISLSQFPSQLSQQVECDAPLESHNLSNGHESQMTTATAHEGENLQVPQQVETPTLPEETETPFETILEAPIEFACSTMIHNETPPTRDENFVLSDEDEIRKSIQEEDIAMDEEISSEVSNETLPQSKKKKDHKRRQNSDSSEDIDSNGINTRSKSVGRRKNREKKDMIKKQKMEEAEAKAAAQSPAKYMKDNTKLNNKSGGFNTVSQQEMMKNSGPIKGTVLLE